LRAIKLYSRALLPLNYIHQITALTFRFMYVTLGWVIRDLYRVTTKIVDPSFYLYACNYLDLLVIFVVHPGN